jgi:hypothetical protein
LFYEDLSKFNQELDPSPSYQISQIWSIKQKH